MIVVLYTACLTVCAFPPGKCSYGIPNCARYIHIIVAFINSESLLPHLLFRVRVDVN